MKYVEFEVNSKQFKLEYDIRSTRVVEKKLGKSLMYYATSVGEDGNLEKFPTLDELIILLHGAMQKYQAGWSIQKVEELVYEMDGVDYDMPTQMYIFKIVMEAITLAFTKPKSV